jgi:hypothetical protein
VPERGTGGVGWAEHGFVWQSMEVTEATGVWQGTKRVYWVSLLFSNLHWESGRAVFGWVARGPFRW